jgi:GalNAc-alpha-(1->4)-GalNAc-alpha-(1->3)-diNAcBac-PP-undecaprenol alpha-1,4-N-acetyl-D-galactosaminyltransferase
MKICMLVSSLSNGGAERVATTLCDAWAGRGDKVTLIPTFFGGGTPYHPIGEAVELIYLADVIGIRRRNVFTYLYRAAVLRRLVAERKPDVVVSFLPNVNVSAILSLAFLGIPLIICERTDPTAYLYPAVLRTLCKLTYRFADMLAVQTESVAAKVMRLYPGLQMVRAVPNPLPAGVARHERRNGTHRKILLSLGRLSPEKQSGKLLAAFAELASSFPEWDLHIYGDGPEKHLLEWQKRAYALEARVMLMGQTENPWAVMADADAFAMASRSEGFPNALLEAMAVGLPCAVFDCPSGPQEITRGGKDALLVPLDDHAALVAALARLMGESEAMQALGSQARESVRARYGLAGVIEQWDGLFEDVGALRREEGRYPCLG